jgi:hypothetical protein
MTNSLAVGVAFADPPLASGATVAAGGSGAPGRLPGTLNVPTYSSTGQGNAADATDDVLLTYTLPANTFDVAGRQVNITAMGKVAANGNNKRIKIWFGTTTQTPGLAVAGGTVIADSGTVTTNNLGWIATATVTKYGAPGSNTQVGAGAVISGATTNIALPAALTVAENAPINITVTGSSATSSSASDVVGQMLQVAFSN